MRTILNDLFGPGTWGTGGNLVATALLAVPTMVTGFMHAARQRRRQHEEKMAQAQAHHEELKQHVTDTMGGGNGGR